MTNRLLGKELHLPQHSDALAKGQIPTAQVHSHP